MAAATCAARAAARALLTLAVALTLLFAAAALGTGRAQAVSLQPLTIEQLSQRAETVAVVRTLMTQARYRASDSRCTAPGTVETVVRLEVLELLKGTAGATMTLSLPGGTAGGLTVFFDYVPVFSAGEVSLLFLDNRGRVVGGPQGKIDVDAGSVLGAGVLPGGLTAYPRSGVVSASPVSAAAGEWVAGAPLIASVTPSSASAGTGTHVTVRGSGFGVSQGSGHVDFCYGRNRVSGIRAPIVAWTDSAIECVVPTGTIENYAASAGSGPVTVFDSAGRASNGYDFHVTFGCGGERWASPAVPYRVNPNTSDTASEEALVDAATATWNTASKFEFVDSGLCTTTSSEDYNDHNDIYWSHTELPDGCYASTSGWVLSTDSMVLAECDIVFNDASYSWGDGSGGSVDIQAVALHELGHVLGLMDLYGPGDAERAMYGEGEPGVVMPRTLDAGDVAGAVYLYGAAAPPEGGEGDQGDGGQDGDDHDGGGQDGASPVFLDVASGHPYFAAIADLVGRQIITGFDDGTFRPFSSVTRQQFAKMIVKTLDLTVTGAETCLFSDVTSQVGSDPLYPSKYVAVCGASGITAGKTATTFAPEDSITRQQLVTMVVRAAGLASPPAGYVAGFSPGQFSLAEHYRNALKAAHAGLLDGLLGVGAGYDFVGACTRGECAQILHNLLLRNAGG